jgi:hypothetical protein
VNITIPKGCEIYANDIRRFVDAMLYKLAVNVHKGRWEDVSVQTQYENLLVEVEELRYAMSEGNTVAVMLEAADVANYALIIASEKLDGG